MLAHMTSVWEEVTAGQRRTILIAGEPGIGKSATAAAWSHQVLPSGGAVTAGRCAPEAVIAYQPFVEILRHLLGHPGILALVSGSAARQQNWPGWFPTSHPLCPTARQSRLSRGPSATSFTKRSQPRCTASPARKPLVVVLDDLHWADTTSIGLLNHLVRHPEQSPLLIWGHIGKRT